MKEIQKRISVEIDYSELSENIIDEFLEHHSNGIGHENIEFFIDWDDTDDKPLLQEYLLITYGEDIKIYDCFILITG